MRTLYSPDGKLLTGIGGWLGLLIFSLIAGSLAAFGQVTEQFRNVEQVFPEVANRLDWQNYKYALLAAWTAFSGLRGYAAYCLIRIRERSSVRIALVSLWVPALMGPPLDAIFSNVYVNVPFSASLPGQMAPWMGMVLLSFFWTLYLNRSQRVQNTYGAA